MKIPITGQSYEHISQATNFQKSINWFLTDPGPNGVGSENRQGTLVLSPGLTELVDLGGGIIRGVYTVGEAIYAACGNKIYKVLMNHITRELISSTLLGTIGTTTGSVYFINNPTQILVTDESSTGYIITIATDAMAAIADTDFRGAKHITYLDGYFIYFPPNTATMYTSALNDGTSWDAADAATAEMRPDNLIGLGVTKGELWAFGEETVEVWYDAGNITGFPLSPRVGSEVDVGCGATGSIVAIDNILMWLDSRGFIVQSDNSPFIRDQSSGYALKIVSTDAINNIIASFDVKNDAKAITYNDRGHIMYQITFPTENRTLVFDHTTQQWHERAYYNIARDQLEYHTAQYHTKFHNLNIVGGQRDGRIYIMHHDYLDDADVPIHRIRQTAYQQNEFKEVEVACFALRLDTGYAEQGQNPMISMRYSNDNGHRWSYSMARELGKVGEYNKIIEWNRLGSNNNWLFEIATNAAVKFAIVEAYVDISSVEQY